ncbi:hypothetical protein [Candidatus Xianfuyuplasma coldseepsis]|uniref:Uncharacterized protein n=1 Tax=Candidatus Xianfuyuplasma coldseepsis TaxID=2782163 RepID=A0A7L7KQS7_9MOLU|nr:hypothetical protein [Xianfuyuplasma coldseepsis]QMS84632.1 hypothetical protein G4Z02_02325 [Xianfuyuplasma coldseepsis]
MPQNLDYELYLNVAFFAIIGLGFIIGYIRGLRKSLYSLVVTVLFYGLFFLTIDQVVNALWELPIPQLFQQLSGAVPELAGETTLGGGVSTMVDTYLPAEYAGAMDNAHFASFVTGIALFVVKLVYTVIYFTVGQLIFKFIFMIIRLLFFSHNQAMDNYKHAKRQVKKQRLKKRDIKRMRKELRMEYKKMSRKERRELAKIEKKREKKRRKKNDVFSNSELIKYLEKPSRKPFFGAIFGAAKGTVTAFVTLILLGGLINIMDSMMTVFPEDPPTVSHQDIERIYLANQPLPTMIGEPSVLATGFQVPAGMESQLDMARDLIEAFNNNVFVTNASTITYTSEDYDGDVALHLYLFDSVLSFTFEEERIMLRQELDVLSDTAAVFMNSEYAATNDLADITAEEIELLFTTLSDSRLITTMLPVAIEAGSELIDVPIDIPIDELYALDWSAELQSLGAVASVGFDLVNTAGILTEGADLETITLDGDEVESLFDSLADSELVTLGAYIAIEPLLEQAGEQIQAIITVPEDLVWEDEFRAFGAVAGAVLNTGLTMADLSMDDPMNLLTAMSGLDFTVLLDSAIVTRAMVNVFSGAAGIEGLDQYIIVPDGTEWYDVLDGETVVNAGELRNILTALGSIVEVSAGFDLNNLSLDMLADLDDDTIDTIFESGVLVATISNFLLEADLGSTPLVIPDSVLDINGYITAVEMKAVATSARVVADELACDEDDLDCDMIDIAKAFNLSDTSIDTLTTSDIIGATVGQLILDQGGEVLTVPNSALATIQVDSLDVDVVSKEEIRRIFKAVGLLEFTDLENIDIDPTIVQTLATVEDETVLDTTKTDTLFASRILHATLTQTLLDLTGDTGVMSIPYYAEDDTTQILVYDDTDEMNYISITELNNVLQAIMVINIQDFEDVDALNLGEIIANSGTILESSILQATISNQVLGLGEEAVTVPYEDEDGNPIRVMVGDPLLETDTEYIVKSEIQAVLEAVEIFGITDINEFGGDLNMESVFADATNNVPKLLNSATLHATISQQLFNLEEGGAVAVPYFAEDGTTEVRKMIGPVGFETEIIIKSEIEAMIDVLDILDITSNLDSFDGNVDIGAILSGEGNVDTLLASATIQATVSKQLLDLQESGALAVPYFAENGTAVRVVVGNGIDDTQDTEYIKQDEIRAMLDVLDILDIASNLTEFDGNVDIGAVLGTEGNVDILLSSATIQATVSKQLFELDAVAVPYFAENGTTEIRILSGNGIDDTQDTEYIKESEIRAMLDVLEILGVTSNLSEFDPNIGLDVIADPDNLNAMLASSTIQATISKQMFELGAIAVPYYEEDGVTLVRVTVGNTEDGTNSEYIKETEIRALIDALEALGLLDIDIDQFDGTFDMSSVSDPVKRAALLASSTIKSTISQQMIDLEAIIVPEFQEDNSTPVRKPVGSVEDGTNSEYIVQSEIETLFDSMEALGLLDTDITAFDGSVDMTAVSDPIKRETLLSSTIIQATISKQMIDLAAIVVPQFREDGTTPVRVLVGTGETTVELIKETEIRALFDSMEVLGLLDQDITAFDGSVDMSAVSDPTNRDIILSSATLQATISKQMIDLTAIVVPYYEEDGVTTVRVTVGTGENAVELIKEAEIRALFDSMEVLGLLDQDITTFDGNVDIASASSGGNKAILLGSSTIQATISKQLIDLDTGGTIRLPFVKEDDSTLVRYTVGTGETETEYVLLSEISALIDALNVLDLGGDIAGFSADSVDISLLGQGTNANTVFASAMIQATVSEQVLDLVGTTADTIIVPMYKQDGSTLLQLSVGDELEGTDDVYILASELADLVQAIALILPPGSNISSFSGNVDLNTFFVEANRIALLESSIMQATISKQLIEIEGTLIIPDADVDGTAVRVEVGTFGNPDYTEYLTVNELDALIIAFEKLGLGNVDDFTGSIDLTNLALEANQDAVLASAAVHATISDILTGFASNILIVPHYMPGNEDPGDEVRKTVSGTEFIIKAEVKSLIDVFNTILPPGSDMNSFNTDLQIADFFTHIDLLLKSYSFQATLSSKLLDTGGALIVPDINVNTLDPVRLGIHADGVEYIDEQEMEYIVEGLNEMQLTNFGSMTFDLATVFNAEFETVLLSASLQATISDSILNVAQDETTATVGAATLIVPLALREAIAVATIPATQIEKDELLALLDTLELLGFSDFGGSVSSSFVTGMADKTPLFESGSMHATIDNILRGNTVSEGGALLIPDQAEETLYGMTVTKATEIIALMDAVTALGQGDFASASFSLATILGASGSEGTIADSMIARFTLYDEVYALATGFAVNPFRALVPEDYEPGTDVLFITQTFIDIVQHDYLTP